MSPATLPETAGQARTVAATWLGHLPIDRRGLPVPWINRWGPETLAHTRIGWDHHVNRRAFFHDDYGAIPDFTRQNIGREREAVTQGLCQVCGRPVPWSRRNLVLSGVSTESIWLDDLNQHADVVTEPWLDDRCAAIAALLCPVLIRRRHDDDMQVVAVRSPHEVRIVISVGTVDIDELAAAGGPPAHPDRVSILRAALNRGPVAMWAKILLLDRANRSPVSPRTGGLVRVPTR